MPRMKAPKGYYTISEAAKVLDLSSAMVRRYVEKGRIQYLLPEGRSHGFYLKKDVDDLAYAINALFHIGDEDGTTVFKPANKEELKDAIRIARSLFSNDNQDEIIIPDWRYKILEKNPQTFQVLKKDGNVVGFFEILSFRPETEKIEILLRSERVGDANITEEDIERFESGKHIHLYIAGIGVDPKLERLKRRGYGAFLVSKLIGTVIDLGRNGVIIENITALGATKMGVRLMQHFGMHEIPERAPGKRAFTLNIEESGSPVSQDYKQAFKQSGTLKSSEE